MLPFLGRTVSREHSTDSSDAGDDPPHDAMPLIRQHEDVDAPVYGVFSGANEAAP